MVVIIAIIVIWHKIDRAMEIKPYKKSSIEFVSVLKKSKVLKAQTLLDNQLQYLISVNDISKFISNTNLKSSNEIVWEEWSKKDNQYIITSKLHFKDGSFKPMEIKLERVNKESIVIDKILIGDVELKHIVDKSIEFLR